MHMMASQFQSQMMTIDDNQMPIDKGIDVNPTF